METNDPEADPVFHFHFAQVVQARLPMPVLHEIFGGAFREQDVPGVAAIHHPLRQVDPGARDVGAIVDVDHFVDRAAVDSHPQPQFRMLFVGARELESALRRGFRIVAKDERHTVTRCEADELSRILGRADLLRPTHQYLQMLEQFALLVNE